MKLGTNNISAIYVGGDPVQKVYRGASEVWTAPDSGGGEGLPCDKVRVYPRAGLANRINGAKICGSNTSFTADLVELATISGFTDGWNEIAFSNTTEYQYLIIESGGNLNVPEAAEIEFLSGSTVLTPLEIQSASEYNSTYSADKAFDGNTATEHATAGGVGNWIGIRVS